MYRMRIVQLELLNALNKETSLAKASESLFISQPSGSLAIKELENELGCALFDRTHRGLIFNEKGRAVLTQAQIILDEIEKIRTLSRRSHKRKFMIGFDRNAGNEFFAKAISALKNDMDIDIESIWKDRDELISDIIGRQLDICIVSLATKQYEPELWQIIEESGMVFKELYKEYMCFLVSEDHPLSDENCVILYDILQYPYVTMNNNRDKYFVNLYRRLGADRRITYIDDAASFYKFLQYTRAIGVCVSNSVNKINVRYGRRLKAVYIDNFKFYYQVGLLFRNDFSDKEFNEIVQVFSEINYKYIF